MKRICSSCKKEKVLKQDFYKQPPCRSTHSGGYLTKCKECTLAYNRKISSKKKNKESIWANKLQYRYGISVEEYNLLLKKQEGCCAICKTKDPSTKRKNTNKFHVDHCHKTGRVRGLLCNSCNTAIGYLEDDPEIVLAAFNYLRRT